MSKDISISDSLYNEIEAAHKKRGGDGSIQQFIDSLIRKGLSEAGQAVYQQHDEEKIKERLQSLGYID